MPACEIINTINSREFMVSYTRHRAGNMETAVPDLQQGVVQLRLQLYHPQNSK